MGVSGGGADEEDVVDGEEFMAVALELMGQMDIEISDQEGVASVVDMASGGGGGGSGAAARGDGGIPVVAAPTVSDKQENMDEVSRVEWSWVGSSWACALTTSISESLPACSVCMPLFLHIYVHVYVMICYAQGSDWDNPQIVLR